MWVWSQLVMFHIFFYNFNLSATKNLQQFMTENPHLSECDEGSIFNVIFIDFLWPLAVHTT